MRGNFYSFDFFQQAPLGRKKQAFNEGWPLLLAVPGLPSFACLCSATVPKMANAAS
jgi:hypothetical protein